jgi:hypothetical protein
MFDSYKNYLDADVFLHAEPLCNGRMAFCQFYRHDCLLQTVREVAASGTPDETPAKGHHRTVQSDI